jgi:lipoate-protein ligase A
LYQHFTKPLTGYLAQLGVAAEFSGRNDVTVDGRKISGNAQYFSASRMFHHGTILFDSNLEVLSSVLQPDP